MITKEVHLKSRKRSVLPTCLAVAYLDETNKTHEDGNKDAVFNILPFPPQDAVAEELEVKVKFFSPQSLRLTI